MDSSACIAALALVGIPAPKRAAADGRTWVGMGLAGAVVAYAQLLPLSEVEGGFVSTRLGWILPGIGVLAAGLLAIARPRRGVRPGGGRDARVAAISRRSTDPAARGDSCAPRWDPAGVQILCRSSSLGTVLRKELSE